MPSPLPRTALQLSLVLALALTAVPLDRMFGAARDPGGVAAGMSAPALWVMDGTMRLATPAGNGSSHRFDMVAVPASTRVTTAPRDLRWLQRAVPPDPVARMIALSRMQDDGG